MNKQAFLVIFLLMISAVHLNAQQKQKFSIASFELDQFDMTAKNEQYKKIDGNGSLYAIIKVTSTNPDDDLKAYNFNFGNMNSLVEQHDGELWVYVQRNAKMVTISRQGYTTINKHDLKTTIESGKTYVMQLSVAPVKIQMQMVLFTIEPSDCKAMVTVKSSAIDAMENVIGITDETGTTAKNMPYGTYTYKIASEDYYPTEGSFVLNDKTKTHHEQIKLRPRFAETTLIVDADADIYVNGELKGRRIWTGRLDGGNYNVECRQLNHRTSSQYITVEEGTANSFTLTPPTSITGSVSIITNPRASISIDGKSYGLSPQNINDLLVGQHTITLTKEGYADERIDVTIIEGEMAEINRRLTKGKATLASQPAIVVQQEDITTPKSPVNPNANQKLYNKYVKRSNTKKWVGWLGGLAFVGLGLGAESAADEENAGVNLGIFSAIGTVWTTSFLLSAQKNKKKAMQYKEIVFQTNGLKLKNGSSLSASIDVLKDGITHKQTLGLGLQYSF